MNSSKGAWKSAIFIIFVEVAERFAYYGVAGNLFSYLIKEIGLTTATAAKNVNIWQGVSALFPVVGGFLADSYTGRFWTIIFSSLIYLTGLVLLTMAAAIKSIPHRHTFFFVALYILTIGEGGHKPCVQTFAADQFDDNLPEEKAAKSSFFNWWYVGIVCGATAAVLVVIYVQEYVSWGLGFGMLAVAVAVALVVFLIGCRSYRRQAPVGSPFTRVAQVVVAAMRKRRLSVRDGRGVCYDDEISGIGLEVEARVPALAPTSQFQFLDKAAIIDDIDASSEKRDAWRLCSVNQVEEVKLLLQLIPIWFSCLTFAVVIAQLGTYFTKQGSTMNRLVGRDFRIPAASFQVFTGFTILISVLLYERLLVPKARQISGHSSGITILQRIGFGLFLSILTMVVAASVEARRVAIARKHGLVDSPATMVPMRIWWLLPQYMLTGLSDVFTVVGLQELFYDQMPAGLRSIGAAAYISVVGVGSLLSSVVISVVQGISARSGHKWLGNNINQAELHYFYLVLAGLSAANLGVYICVAKRFVYKKVESQGRSSGKA